MQISGYVSPVVRVKRPKKVRHYIVAYECPNCFRHGYLEDFTGSQETTHTCGQVLTIEVE
jgi:hypothetical protein